MAECSSENSFDLASDTNSDIIQEFAVSPVKQKRKRKHSELFDSNSSSSFTGQNRKNIFAEAVSDASESHETSDSQSSDTSIHIQPQIQTPVKKRNDLAHQINSEIIGEDQEVNETINNINQSRVHEDDQPQSIDGSSTESECDPSRFSSSDNESEVSDEGNSSNESDDDQNVSDSDNIYSGSSMSNEKFDALLLALSQKHHMSDAALDDFLKFVKLVLPEDSNIASSSYKFYKRNEQCTLIYVHVFVCPECLEKVKEKEFICHNNNCIKLSEKIEPIGFFNLPIKPQIQRLIEEYWEQMKSYRNKLSGNSGYLKDIQDGSVYQKFAVSNSDKQIFSLVASSDGAPMIKSRKYNIWPLMCFLVELPPPERYKMQNILLAGIWYGKEKPNVPLFLKYFVDELNDLSNNSIFHDSNGTEIPAVCRIQSVVPDLPAKAMLFNVKQYNGEFGCTTCKHPGCYDNELRSRLYEYTASQNMPRRTAAESRVFANLAERNRTTVFGFKGQNVFGKLVSIPDNLPIDWMHCVCEGILKRQLFKRWFDSSFSNEEYSLFDFSEKLDVILLSIQVPHDFTRKPRSIADRKHWKASEFRIFVLFAGLPCLRQAVKSDSFSIDHFYHFALLVTALRYLHSVPVLTEKVKIAQVLLDNFVRLVPILYDKKECTYNCHALIHFPEQVLDNGSLSFISAFVFESFISKLKSLYNGTRGIPKQMVEKLGISQGYKRNVLKNCMDSDTQQFARYVLKDRQHNIRNVNGIILHEPISLCTLQPYLPVVTAAFGVQPNDQVYQVCYRMTKENVTYHSTMYPRKGKSCSYIVQYCHNPRNLAYGKVVCYILFNNEAYALINRLCHTGINVCQQLQDPSDDILREIVKKNLVGLHFVEVEDSDNAVIVHCSYISKRCLFVSTDSEHGFVTVLDTPYEHD